MVRTTASHVSDNAAVDTASCRNGGSAHVPRVLVVFGEEYIRDVAVVGTYAVGGLHLKGTLLTMARFTKALFTIALLTMALRTMALLTIALLTIALLTRSLALLTKAPMP